MTTDSTNKRTTVRFGGPEDSSIRSAWKSTNRSFQPPSPAERKATIGMDTLEKARADAALVASLDSGSSHEPATNSHEALGLTKPSKMKARSKTVPILKHTTRTADKDNNDEVDNPPLMASRSAWDNNETRHSFRSVQPPGPAKRQATLEESELRQICDSVAAMGFVRDLSNKDFRGSSTRKSSITEILPEDTHEETTERSDDSGC